MKNNSNLSPVLLIVFICFFVFFINNRVIIPDIMESRNMVTANEMVYDGNWLVPTMNGELRFEKPPLPTWIAAGAEMIAPGNLGIQRAMSGLAAVMLAVFFYFIGLQLMHNRRFALVSTLILITCFNVFMLGRTASWDIYCHAFMLGGIFFLIKAFRDENTTLSFIWAGIFMGLSLMSKGPVSFYALFLPFILAYSFVYRPKMQGKWKGIVVLILLCLIVGGWWYGYIYAFHSEEMQYVVNKESDAWVNRSVRPWYYYWKFFLETGIWSVLMVTALFLPVWAKEIRKQRSFWFAYSWMFLVLILLSCLPEKKTRYLFPILIPSCYVMGYLIVYWYQAFKESSPEKINKILFRLNAWLMAIVVALLPIGGFIFLYPSGYVSLIGMIFLTIVVELITFYLIRCAVNLQPLRMIGGVTALFVVIAAFVLPLLTNIINNPELNSISQVREIDAIDDIPFYYNDKDELRIELVYAAGRKIRPLDVAKEGEILNNLPMVLLTHAAVSEELPASLLQQVDTLRIGVFDDNRWSKKDKRYRPGFIYTVTLLSKKE